MSERELERRPATFGGPTVPQAPTGELARRNILFGLALLGVFVLLFAGTVVVALIYLAVAG
ncbi:MAG: hypothetical protein ACRDN6_15800 [Gaiellaceae bacterium]